MTPLHRSSTWMRKWSCELFQSYEMLLTVHMKLLELPKQLRRALDNFRKTWNARFTGGMEGEEARKIKSPFNPSGHTRGRENVFCKGTKHSSYWESASYTQSVQSQWHPHIQYAAFWLKTSDKSITITHSPKRRGEFISCLLQNVHSALW